MRRSSAFTLIELVIVVVIVAILAASAYPIYRAIVNRAYEGEILSGMGIFRGAERMYRAEAGKYGTQSDLEARDFLASKDFFDLKYVQYADFSFSAQADDTYTIQWAGTIDGYKYSKVTMDQAGSITRTE